MSIFFTTNCLFSWLCKAQLQEIVHMKNSPFLVQVETFLVCCIFTIVFVLEMCLLSLIHTFLYSLFLYEILHLLLIVLAFLVVFVKLIGNHSIYHQLSTNNFNCCPSLLLFFQMEFKQFFNSISILNMTRSVKKFHFFLTFKPDLNFSYLKLKTFIYEVLIYHQWMCKVLRNAYYASRHHLPNISIFSLNFSRYYLIHFFMEN